MFRRSLRLMAILLSCGVAVTGATDSAVTRELVGQAYDRRTGEELYTEHHFQRLLDRELIEHRVEYRDPAGRIIATKTLDYDAHPFAPAFRMVDLRDGYIEGAEHTPQGYRLYRGRDDAFESERIEVRDELVSDSGFDRYVKAHLDALVEGRSVRFRMAVVGRLADYRLMAHRLERRALFGRDAVTIRVTADSLLRLFIDPLDVTYDVETGRLLRYVGTSNLRSPSGERYDARIDFPPTDPSRGIATADFP